MIPLLTEEVYKKNSWEFCINHLSPTQFSLKFPSEKM